MKHEPIERYTPEQRPRVDGLPVLIDQLYKRFSTQTVLKGIDLRIEPGEFVAIVGRSGCGKSTLLRLIAGLDQASDGSIRLGTQPAQARREDVRMMFQDSRLLPWKTVLDNVGLGLRGDWRAAATTALRQVGLESRAGEWPAVLSGGQRQRVALARALVHQPRLLLLDEPLGALDALTRIEMQQLIEDLWRASGFTALLVTHDVAEAVALADRILLVEDGRITYDVRVDLPRPRHRGAAGFARIEEDVLERILKQPVRPDAPTRETVPAEARHVRDYRWAV